MKLNKYLAFNFNPLFLHFITYFTTLLASPYWQDKDKQKDLSVPGAGVSVI